MTYPPLQNDRIAKAHDLWLTSNTWFESMGVSDNIMICVWFILVNAHGHIIVTSHLNTNAILINPLRKVHLNAVFFFYWQLSCWKLQQKYSSLTYIDIDRDEPKWPEGVS